MLMLVIGGSGSGKSEYAEQRAAAISAESLYYLATMRVQDEEGSARVKRHQLLRAAKGFTTIERPVTVSAVDIPKNSTVLLECLGNLLLNTQLACKNGAIYAAQMVLDEIVALLQKCRNLIIVSNDIFGDGQQYDFQTEQYKHQLAWIHNRLTAISCETVEVVCGIPVRYK